MVGEGKSLFKKKQKSPSWFRCAPTWWGSDLTWALGGSHSFSSSAPDSGGLFLLPLSLKKKKKKEPASIVAKSPEPAVIACVPPCPSPLFPCRIQVSRWQRNRAAPLPPSALRVVLRRLCLCARTDFPRLMQVRPRGGVGRGRRWEGDSESVAWPPATAVVDASRSTRAPGGDRHDTLTE